MFVGELSLDGSLRRINGALNIALGAERRGFKELFLPEENAEEAAMVKKLKVIPAKNLTDVIYHLEGTRKIKPQKQTDIENEVSVSRYILTEIKGQAAAKRALAIAAAGCHNILFYGPPGTGKTMLAEALISLLPPPSYEEIIEMTEIWSAAGLLSDKKHFISSRQLRSPHHTSSLMSIAGGGQDPKPGEISLAHRGVLFLDELPEFKKDVLETLRQPLESGEVTISRVRKILSLPAKFMFVAAKNPCPCGYFGDPDKECVCSANEIMRYNKKISGPLLDRIDIQINVPRIKIEELKQKGNATEESEIREEVRKARLIQEKRFKENKLMIFTNSEMSSSDVDNLIKLDDSADMFLKNIMDKNMVSGRGYYRTLKVAQTIADLENSPVVTTDHLAEAFQYRTREE